MLFITTCRVGIRKICCKSNGAMTNPCCSALYEKDRTEKERKQQNRSFCMKIIEKQARDHRVAFREWQFCETIGFINEFGQSSAVVNPTMSGHSIKHLAAVSCADLWMKGLIFGIISISIVLLGWISLFFSALFPVSDQHFYFMLFQGYVGLILLMTIVKVRIMKGLIRTKDRPSWWIPSWWNIYLGNNSTCLLEKDSWWTVYSSLFNCMFHCDLYYWTLHRFDHWSRWVQICIWRFFRRGWLAVHLRKILTYKIHSIQIAVFLDSVGGQIEIPPSQIRTAAGHKF